MNRSFATPESEFDFSQISKSYKQLEKITAEQETLSKSVNRKVHMMYEPTKSKSKRISILDMNRKV